MAVALLACAAAGTSPARGQSAPPVRLPSNPAQWLNTPPLSPQMLQGKGIVLFFFDTGG